MKLLLIMLSAVVLSGCATSDNYKQYAETQKLVANARAMTEAARIQAITEIAKTGDMSAKIAAVMSLSATPLPTPVEKPSLFFRLFP
jgi:hypothetical protein